MRAVAKIAVLAVLLAGLSAILSGCAFQPEEDLSAFVSREKETVYEGILDYQHVLHFVDEEKGSEEKRVYFEGEIEDLSGGEAGDRDLFLFKEVFTITKDALIDSIEGKMQDNHSIISDKIVLKKPLKEGNSWTQEFEYKGKKYIAESRIAKINGEPGSREVVVETVVNNIEGFPGNTYKETAVYRENCGLVYYKRSLGDGTEFDFRMWKSGIDIAPYEEIDQ